MIRLLLHCDDRIGLTSDVLQQLVRDKVDLRGIELGDRRLYLKLALDEEQTLTNISEKIALIQGIDSVEKVTYFPSEREHLELKILLSSLPEAVASIDHQGNVLAASPAFNRLFQIEHDVPNNLRTILADDMLFDAIHRSENAPAHISFRHNGQSLLIESFSIVDHLDNSLHPDLGVVIHVKESSSVAAQLVKWQRTKDLGFDEIVAECEAMKQCIAQGKAVARLDAPLLISGETGTGKELFSRACHNQRTKGKPFLALNCAALPDHAAETELFGYAPGAFEGAEKSGKPGLLELAEGGTVFFDEIGEMSPYLQSKLIRFLEEGSFRRIGNDQEVKVNVRVIASSQKNLAQLCQQGEFREDLFYRLNVLNLHLPPLRKRRNDIVALTEYFISTACERIAKPTLSISQRALLALQRYNWPGNVRELENIVFRAVSVCETDNVTTKILNMPMQSVLTTDIDELDPEWSLIQMVGQFEKSLLEYLYPQFPSSRKLAKKLSMSHTAIANKLREYNIR